jgi:hypothetical protein
MAVTLRTFQLLLPEDVYHALRDEAAAAKQPATAVARQAIVAWLRERKKTALKEAIAAYADEQGGTTADLDFALEGAGLSLFRPAKRRRK